MSAHAYNRFTSDGSTVEYECTWDGVAPGDSSATPFISTNDIHAYHLALNPLTGDYTATEVSFTFGSTYATVVLDDPITIGDDVLIVRETADEYPLVNFESAPVITAATMNKSQRQLLMLVQEAVDYLNGSQLTKEQVKIKYELNPDTNAFTDDYKAKADAWVASHASIIASTAAAAGYASSAEDSKDAAEAAATTASGAIAASSASAAAASASADAASDAADEAVAAATSVSSNASIALTAAGTATAAAASASTDAATATTQATASSSSAALALVRANTATTQANYAQGSAVASADSAAAAQATAAAITAGTIPAPTATKLATARTFTFTGDATGSGSFDGSASPSIALTVSGLTSKANLASPTFTGTPLAPTATAGTATTQIATTAFVNTSFAKLASPALTGTPTAPTATAGTNTTQLATTAFVLANAVSTASPTFTGTPAAPTAAADTATTQLATTAFVIGQAGTATPVVDGTATVGTSVKFARQDHIHPSDTTKANLASPTFTGTPAAPTAATFTSTTQIATTAFVNAVGAKFSGYTSVTAAYTLLATDYGKVVMCSGSSAYTLTLPSVGSTYVGAILTIWNYGLAVKTVARAGTDVIYAGQSISNTSLTIRQGEDLILVNAGSGVWLAVGGLAVADLALTTAYVGGATGYHRMVGGLIIQQGTFTSSGTGAGNISVTFPLAFTSAAYMCSFTAYSAGTQNICTPYYALSTTGAQATAIVNAVNTSGVGGIYLAWGR